MTPTQTTEETDDVIKELIDERVARARLLNDRINGAGVMCGACGAAILEGQPVEQMRVAWHTTSNQRINYFAMRMPLPTTEWPAHPECAAIVHSRPATAAHILGDAEVQRAHVLTVEGEPMTYANPNGTEARFQGPLFAHELAGAKPGGRTPNRTPWAHCEPYLREAMAEIVAEQNATHYAYPAGCQSCRVDRQPREHGAFVDHGTRGVLCKVCSDAEIEAGNLHSPTSKGPQWAGIDIAIGDHFGIAASPGFTAEWKLATPRQRPASATRFDWVDGSKLFAALQADELERHRKNNHPDVSK